jgi:hypothetical protein
LGIGQNGKWGLDGFGCFGALGQEMLVKEGILKGSYKLQGGYWIVCCLRAINDSHYDIDDGIELCFAKRGL